MIPAVVVVEIVVNVVVEEVVIEVEVGISSIQNCDIQL